MFWQDVFWYSLSQLQPALKSYSLGRFKKPNVLMTRARIFIWGAPGYFSKITILMIYNLELQQIINVDDVVLQLKV